MFISLTCSPYASDSKRKRSDLSNTNISKDEGKLGSKPKLKIVYFRKSLEPFVPSKEDGSSHVKISGIDIVIPAMPIPTIPIQSIAPLLQDKLPVRVCEPSTKKVIELPPESAENTMEILDAEPNPTECMEVDKNVARVFVKVILDKVCRIPFDGLPSLKGDFDSIYATILQRGVGVTPLESKVEGLINQACDFKDLQQSYCGLTSTEEPDNCRMEVQDQQKGLSSQVAASEHLLQEAEWKVIDLHGHIDIFNATEVMDLATKASLEKVQAYIKESFKDLKNFQWNP
ncbi:hypothetical protein Cgig2_001962 [Carnegiea gigantea]|uniref:Uncharacterized protein n=1 Tax=Carnegiea gigantea TaxID=171969 RepID=A0A9Q1Q7U0_9CARY|nr:hypothetical protein Cgig2_001962 [Carnegiea gigantea]